MFLAKKSQNTYEQVGQKLRPDLNSVALRILENLGLVLYAICIGHNFITKMTWKPKWAYDILRLKVAELYTPRVLHLSAVTEISIS